MTIFFDTETCGFHGPIVLIQYAEDDGPIQLHSVWNIPIQETIELIENFCNQGVVGFNLAFDWFHICQLYTTLLLHSNWHEPPNIDEYARLEKRARDGPCLKPKSAFDVMLHARKGPYQSTMNRGDIRIKKIPTALAWEIVKELDVRISLKDIYFAKKKDKKKRWQVEDIHDDFGDVVPEFKNIVLRFAPSSALKALAEDALGIQPDSILKFTDVEISSKAKPKEYGYAPFALAVGDHNNWKGAWPDFIHIHISHWSYNSLARKYASDDVDYTRRLYYHFDSPEIDDDDSVLACMVGAVRWRGYKVNLEGIRKLKKEAEEFIANIGFNYKSSAVCRKYMEEVLDETQKLVLRKDDKITTKAVVLEEIAKWTEEEVCEICKGQGCSWCIGGLVPTDKMSEPAKRARTILDARHAQKEIENYDKFLRAGRFHASFVVIGTLSSRMAGSDQLNPQGIKRAEKVRSQFPLAHGGMILCGGDFEGFEVVLMDAAYGDPKMRKDLQSGKKIHGMWGVFFFPGKTYEEICATKGAADPWDDLYTRSKNGVFAVCYFGEDFTLVNRVGIDKEVAEEALQLILKEYPTFARKRQETVNKFCSMKQPGGIGTRVEWHEPADHISSMFGFKRYFTLENQICKALYQLAEKPPDEWQRIKLKVVRRDREQTASGALQSACFAAAFATQASNMRAAGNHVIQSSGAFLTKRLQRRIWDLQPAGINAWRVQPMNVHDEILCPAVPECIEKIDQIQKEVIEEFRPKVPLLSIDWSNKLTSWASK